MMKSTGKRALAALGAILLVIAIGPPAAAKVIFTGYGDLRVIPITRLDIEGEDGVLNYFGLTDRRRETHQFTADAVGLFATTSFGEQLSFNADLTFRQLRYNATELRLQYAYLDYAPREELSFQFGKVTLPFGWLNEHQFYPFQREELTPPIFQSAILGLPIADLGAIARIGWDWEPFDLNLAAYAVNGYSNVTGSPNALRLPAGIGLVMANNLIASNSNENISFGGQVELANLLQQDLRLGVSAYSGPWDPAGRQNLTMSNAHLVWKRNRLELGAEGLLIDANGDLGFALALGTTNWVTRGYFVRGLYQVAEPRGMPLYVYTRYERYRTDGDGGGNGMREYLRSLNAGVSLHVNENLTVKTEVGRLDYELPVDGQGLLDLEARSVSLGASLNF